VSECFESHNPFVVGIRGVVNMEGGSTFFGGDGNNNESGMWGRVSQWNNWYQIKVGRTTRTLYVGKKKQKFSLCVLSACCALCLDRLGCTQ
jgi:hypothetical protein